MRPTLIPTAYGPIYSSITRVDDDGEGTLAMAAVDLLVIAGEEAHTIALDLGGGIRVELNKAGDDQKKLPPFFRITT
jgi:hypothetical protein